jgi:glycosyltransferase involved in cell wall biosynthesis
MIQLLNRSFHPDTEATGQHLTELAAALARSFSLTAICGRSYTVPDRLGVEWMSGVKIVRVPHVRWPKRWRLGRLANWLTFAASALAASLLQRARLLWVQTDPPVMGLVALALKRWHRCPLVLNCQDLYPDVAVELGTVGGSVGRAFDAINGRVYREARAIVALGSDMAERIANKGVPRERILVIPTGVDTSRIFPVPREENEYAREGFTLMYSGNVGMTQDFESVLEAAEGAGIRLVLAGGGVGMERLRSHPAVSWMRPQPLDRLAALLSSATLHVIPMKRGLAGCLVPSKVYGVMAAGRPFLAVCDRSSVLARLALEDRCGLWAPPGDVPAARERLHWAMANPEALEELGRNGRRIAVERYDARLIQEEWRKLFASICAESRES